MNLGNDLKGYKDEYFKLIKKTLLYPADKALIKELEDVFNSKSIEYVRIEDEALPQKGSTFRIRKIKKAIKSIELPIVEFPMDTIKQIFDKIVIVDQENYVFVIKTTDKPLEKDALKK